MNSLSRRKICRNSIITCKKSTVLWGNCISHILSNLKKRDNGCNATYSSPDFSFIIQLQSHHKELQEIIDIFFYCPVVDYLKNRLKYQATSKDVCSNGIC